MVEPSLPANQTIAGISGNLTTIGSDTLVNLMILWSETFNSFYPNVNIQIQAAGSSTTPPALNVGTANLGSMRAGK
jgi:phosphate transport system substrate-binding protein